MTIFHRPALAIVLALFSTAALAAEDHHPHWTYEGSEGPEHWSSISPEFSACSLGQHQSPIDLAKAQQGDNVELALGWTPFAPVVLNNGHTIQAVAASDNTTTFSGKTYALQQMHFHHPSEHAIDGKRAPMEAHFVNKGSDGKLLVLGVLIDEGAANPQIAELWQVAPQSQGEAKTKEPVDFAKLVPLTSKFYRYSGSLTTPPCSEAVEWVVFADPITASREQIDAFAHLYPANSRPLQAPHERTITLGR